MAVEAVGVLKFVRGIYGGQAQAKAEKEDGKPAEMQNEHPTFNMLCRKHLPASLCRNLISLSANEVGGEGRGEVEFLISRPSPRASLRGEGSALFDAGGWFRQGTFNIQLPTPNHVFP
jgi:hypothetical protein